MRAILYVLALLILVACSSPTAQNDKVTIVCTTSIVADAIENLVPEDAVVIALMGPGIDPHLYKATQGDLERLQSADVVFYNGLHLEGKMGDVLEKLARIKPVFAVADRLDENLLIQLQASADAHDPHIWFDLELWSKAIAGAKDDLITQYPAWRPTIEENWLAFENELLEAHQQARKELTSIPQQNRVLVTAHDAFSYFGRAYGLEVMGLQGISTASEYGLSDVSGMVRYLTDHKTPAVFIESSVPKRSIEAVMEGCKMKGHEVKLGGELYSDALGDAGSGAETLIGAFKANVRTIASGLTDTRS